MSRLDKVNHQMQRVISEIIREEVDNPNLGMISILRVETTPDLRYSKVYFSVFPDDKVEEAFNTLATMKNFIKRLLGKHIRMKFTPDLEFIPDDSIKYSIDISKKIEDIKDELE